RAEDEQFRSEPVSAADWSGEDALDEAIGARAGHHAGCHDDECERHESIGDEAVGLQPSALGAKGGESAQGEQDDTCAEPCEAAAHGGLQFLCVERCDLHSRAVRAYCAVQSMESI